MFVQSVGGRESGVVGAFAFYQTSSKIDSSLQLHFKGSSLHCHYCTAHTSGKSDACFRFFVKCASDS